MSRRVLVVGAKDDPHVQVVAQRLVNVYSAEVEVLDLARFPLAAAATLKVDGSGAVETSFDARQLVDADAVWWRRPYPCLVPAESRHREHLQAECDHFVAGLIWAVEAHWVNDPLANIRASRKVVQLSAAASVGMRVPRTLITNSPQDARDFLQEPGRHVFKRISTVPDLATKTRLVDGATIDRLASLVTCPVVFQEYVPPGYDLRVTWVDGSLFAMRIDTERSSFPEDSRLDYDVPHVAAKVPIEVARKIDQLMSKLGLRFGAIDFRVNASGDHFFLEVNPAGQFLYVEMLTGLPIVAALASLLMGR